MAHCAWTLGGNASSGSVLYILSADISLIRWMFDCSRVPGIDGKDFSLTAAKPGDTGDSGTVVFLRKGRVWKVDATVDGRLLSTQELEKCGIFICDIIVS